MWNEAFQKPDVPIKMTATIAAKILHVTKMVVGLRPEEDKDMKRDRIAREYCSVFCGVLDGRALFTMHEGRIGVVPDKCKAGDQIFSLSGGDVRYILQPIAKGPEYSILSEAICPWGHGWRVVELGGRWIAKHSTIQTLSTRKSNRQIYQHRLSF